MRSEMLGYGQAWPIYRRVADAGLRIHRDFRIRHTDLAENDRVEAKCMLIRHSALNDQPAGTVVMLAMSVTRLGTWDD